MTEWAVTLPAADAATCWAAIDALAHQMRGGDADKTLAPYCADALVDLLLGQADVTTTVTFLLPVQTADTAPDDDRSADGACELWQC